MLTALALFLRIQFDNKHGPILMVMLSPVLLVTYRGGLGPGLFCTALSAGASAYYLLEPIHSFAIHDPRNQLDFVFLIGAGLLMSLFSESTLRARRRAEAINASLLRQMRLLDQTYDGVLIWEWNGPITFWNTAAEKIYGFSEQEAVGRISHELLMTTSRVGLDVILRELEENDEWEGELFHVTRDGRHLIVKSRMLLVREPGQCYVVEANRDVTESQKTESELARIQQRFQTAFRLSPLGKVVIRLADDRITEVNESYGRLVGEEPSAIAGKTWTGNNPLLDSRILTEVRHSLDEGRPVTGIDVRFKRKNGDVGTGVLYAELLQSAPDRHALLVLNDVTTRQRAEDKLRMANHDLQQFAYAAAHDLQEPTRNIATSLGLFNRSYRAALDESGIELIEESIESAKRMHQMIRDLLAFSHADNETLQEVRVDANEILRRVMGHLRLIIEDTEAEIDADILPVLAMQPTHLLQLLQNLIGNALKYRTADVAPRIRIRAQLEGSIWNLSVADNGIGFDSAFAEQIFGVFKRLHSVEYSGNGIGLAICERIVRLYGGRIWAESAPGKGSTFFFTLPAVDAAVSANSNTMETAV